MVIKTLFELESIKDQLALLSSLTSHIDIEEYQEKEELNPDYEKLLIKMNNTAKNLKDKLDTLNILLNN